MAFARGGLDGWFRLRQRRMPKHGIRQIISDPAYVIYQSHFSPDGRWIVFQAFLKSRHFESAVFVVPASGGGKWIRITDGRHWDDKPRWSPDGKTIYFLSRRGRFL